MGMKIVTFKAFAKLAKKRGWTQASLTRRFRGKIDGPSDYFAHVLGGRFPATAVAYRSVLSLYWDALGVSGQIKSQTPKRSPSNMPECKGFIVSFPGGW